MARGVTSGNEQPRGECTQSSAASIRRLMASTQMMQTAHRGEVLFKQPMTTTEPKTTFSIGGRWPGCGELARSSSGAGFALPGVTVSSLGLPSDQARNGHALASGSI
jgi:hypothetical protein